MIYYDPVMEPSSFRALLDGSEVTNLFHVRSGELELVSVPLGPGQHHLTIWTNNKAGLSTEQQFYIQPERWKMEGPFERDHQRQE